MVDPRPSNHPKLVASGVKTRGGELQKINLFSARAKTGTDPLSKLQFAVEQPKARGDFTREWYNHSVEVIVKNPDILGGTPVFRGTRVPVQVLFDYLEGGETLEDFLEGFPTVSRESAVAALEKAKQLLLARS
jgi:uncharacterized protein (DUF433 family)